MARQNHCGQVDPSALPSSQIRPVLILGAGINGAAVARELLLNNIPVCIVDRNDIAFGSTAKSSRLIHGGLRYLEYGDIGLVRESLKERDRLLRLAPHFVRPLRLYVPLKTRLGGLFSAILRFCGLSQFRLGHLLAAKLGNSTGRGVWLVRLGLWFYEFLSTDRSLPKHCVLSTTAADIPRVNRRLYRWMFAYWDTQMIYPERFVLALLEDACQIARERASRIDILTYHRVVREGDQLAIKAEPVGDHVPAQNQVVKHIDPCVIVNATGAWGDDTLAQLEVPSRRLFGGTQGSHIFTTHDSLRQEIGSDGIYAEALDGRMIFILPGFEGVLIGTTDIRSRIDPQNAVASSREIDYLIDMVNQVLPDVKLDRDDIHWHYSGIRPLPYLKREATASIPRGHWIDVNNKGTRPVLTLIGGKLTTCRSLAEQVTNFVLKELDLPRIGSTRERVIPGGASDPDSEEKNWRRLSERFTVRENQIRAVWKLCGTRVEQVFEEIFAASQGNDNSRNVGQKISLTKTKRSQNKTSEAASHENLVGTDIPVAFVNWLIENEWVKTLDDLVERRLLLVYNANLSIPCLHALADCLVKAGILAQDRADAEVARNIERLRCHYGRELRKSGP